MGGEGGMLFTEVVLTVGGEMELTSNRYDTVTTIMISALRWAAM